MKGLTVVSKDGTFVVDSREVAEMVGKAHSHLLRDIAGYVDILNQSNFGFVDFFIENTYKDSKGEIRPCYLLTKKGCDMVANKMTGEKGVLFTAAYVIKFEEMESKIKAPASIEDLIIMQAQSVKEIKIKVSQIEENSLRLERANLQLVKEVEINKHRIDTLDCTNIEGTPRQRLGSMVKKYAFDNGIIIPKAWEAFKTSFNIAYRKNIQLLKSNYCKANKKDLTLPEFLEQVGLIEDALRVAEKMLNQHHVQYTAR